MGEEVLKRIIIVTTSFPDKSFQPGQEAAGAFVADFAEELAQHVRVTVIAPGSQDSIESFANFLVYRFAVPGLPLSLLKPANPMQWRKIIDILRAGQRTLQNAVTTEEPEHIFALWALPSGYWARAVGQKHGIPYSIWALGSDIWSLGKVPLISRILRAVLQNSYVCFADGYQLAHDVERIAGRECFFLPSARKLTTPMKKDLATAPPYKLAFLGRWHTHKGVDLLLESLHMLTEADWERIATVRINGGGPLEKKVNSQVKSLQSLGHPIEVGGYLNRDEATELLTWADYLLLPSRIESIPVIFSDAMQANCPLISTPIGDLPRLMAENKIGTLTESVTAVAYTHAIQKALKTPPATYASGLAHTCTQFKVTASVNQLLSYLSNSPS